MLWSRITTKDLLWTGTTLFRLIVLLTQMSLLSYFLDSLLNLQHLSSILRLGYNPIAAA